MKTENGNSCRELELASGRSVVCRSAADSCDEVTIRGPAGEVLLEVALTPAGPVLRFHAAQVQIDCQGSFNVRCGSFAVETAGDIVQRAGGEMSLEARRGNVDVRANDDVNLNGERVRLNC
jgi:hypothetical protein